MNTKLVYVLVSNSQDIYLEQALVSVYSARLQMKDAHICLLVDDLTDKTLTGKRTTILQYITEKVVVNFEGNIYTNQQRSRLLKSSVRKHIEGDFLFIDCDTVICEPLDEVDSFNFDIGAVPDAHVPSSDVDYSPFKQLAEVEVTKVDWPINHEKLYFNSGVLYVKDNPVTHKFYEDWNNFWIQGNSKDIKMDQPSFHMANIANNRIINELNGTWNCQIRHGLRFLNKSKIIHFFGSTINYKTENIYEFMNKRIFFEIKKTGKINSEIHNSIINAREAFPQSVFVLPLRDINFLNSSLISSLHQLYLNKKRTFFFISKTLHEFANLFRKITFK